MRSTKKFGFEQCIQLRDDKWSGDRPDCPRRCPERLHRHGCYERFNEPHGQERVRIQRYFCRQCGLTVSVLPAEPPYRAVKVERVEAYFNEQAEAGSGPDPPPEVLEAGCLRRAWARSKPESTE